MTPEGKVRTHLRKEAKRRGFEHRKLRWIARVGAPDELVFWPFEENETLDAERRHVAALVEVKRQDGKLESHQNREIGRLRKGGFRVFTIYNTDGADMVLDYLTELVQNGEKNVTKRG